MGCDDNSVFQNAIIGVTTKMKKIVVPFMIEIHCFVQQTNLVMLVLSKLSLVAWLEVLLQAIYVFFLSFIYKIPRIPEVDSMLFTHGKGIGNIGI